jgi:hypothetical protein
MALIARRRDAMCASPDEAMAHVRSVIEDLAVRLARQYPAVSC